MGMVRGTFIGKAVGPVSIIFFMLLERNSETVLLPQLFAFYSYWICYNNQWVENGGDTFPGGPIFDNAYHDFLVNTIVANDIPTFAQSTVPHPFVNVAPFNEVFPNWFLDEVSVNPIDLIHLDTDITLAFEPDITTAHPDFSVKTNEYANNNTQFLKEFFKALDKMSKLGVAAPLFPATECKECDFGAGKSLCIRHIHD